MLFQNKSHIAVRLSLAKKDGHYFKEGKKCLDQNPNKNKYIK